MGAGVASLLGRLFHLTRDHMRLIAPIGAAAGIGAAFNTPITVVLFVMEEVVAGWNAGVLGSIVLSAVSAVVVGRWFLGDDPLFRVPAFELTHPSELAVYALIGVVGGILSAWFSRYATRLRGLVKLLPARTRYALPPVAGLLIGAIGVWRPEILGAGYEAIDGALHGHFPWHILILLGLLKMLGSSMCFSAGTPGGMFAPTLFVGAMVGGGLGGLAHLYSPFPTSSAGAYVLVGMGTFFAGVFRAPMTSVFMVFEVSASYVIILPVMIANTVSFLVSRRLQGESLFQIAAEQDGLNLPSLEEQRESPVLSVEDAMNPGTARVLEADATLDEGIRCMKEQSWERALLHRGNGNWWSVERSELEQAQGPGQGSIPLGKAAASTLPAAKLVVRLYPDLPLDTAMRMLGAYPILPVVSRVNRNQLLGTLTLDDVHRAYGIAESPAPE